MYNPYKELTKNKNLEKNPEYIKELEEYLLEGGNPKECYLYSRYFRRCRFKEVEGHILNCPYSTIGYIINVIKGPWKEAEPTLLRESSTAGGYATKVLKKRWLPAEEKILQQSDFLRGIKYVKKVKKTRWPDLEDSFIKSLTSHETPSSDRMSKILKLVGSYIKVVNGLNHHDGDNTHFTDIYSRIMTVCSTASASVIFGILNYYKLREYPEAEPLLFNNAETAWIYISYYKREPDSRIIPHIKKDPLKSFKYSTRILKARFPEGEPSIMTDKYLVGKYLEYLSWVSRV